MTELEIEIQRVNSVVLSAEEEARIDAAIANSRPREDHEIAVAASFDVANRILLIELKTGQRLAVPQEDLQDIHRYSPEDLVEVEIIPTGTALHFEKVMDGVRVDSLRRGVYGSEKWMAGLGARRRLGKAS